MDKSHRVAAWYLHEMWLKIWGNHFKWKVSHNYLNFRERVGVEESNKTYTLLFPAVLWIIRSNFRVAQNGRSVIKSRYPWGGTMVAKILDFRLFEHLKNTLFRTFSSSKLSIESWIFYFLHDNFPEFPPDVT